MAQINPHDAGSACGIESVYTSCVGPLIGFYTKLIALALDAEHPKNEPLADLQEMPG
jgi:hypothetical protein